MSFRLTPLRLVLGAAALGLAGCAGDPFEPLPRLSQTDVADPGLRAEMQGDGSDVVAAAQPPAAVPGASAGPEPGASGAGLMGFLRRNADRATGTTGATQTAMPGDPAPQRAVAAGSIPFGTVLPFGRLERVCNVSDRQLGTRVDSYPEGRGAYRIYDSAPGNTAPHAFYVTGFDDGCARQFTAAVAVFGSPQMHERLRYGLPSEVQPYSETDAAYEQLKSRVCRARRGQPCGSAMTQLARTTVFVSVYERFGSNPVWKTILLHDGDVLATDIRSN